MRTRLFSHESTFYHVIAHLCDRDVTIPGCILTFSGIKVEIKSVCVSESNPNVLFTSVQVLRLPLIRDLGWDKNVLLSFFI